MRDALTRWFVRDFDEGAAEDHDFLYWSGLLPRADIDRAFLAAMLLQADTLRLRIKAFVIFVMVRLCGGPSYQSRAEAIRE